MDKNKIDKIIELIYTEDANEIYQLVNNPELKSKIETYSDLEDGISENADEIIENIRQQIPDDMKDYFERICYAKKMDGLYDDKKIDEYDSFFESQFEEIISKTDDEKIKALDEFPEKYKIEIAKSIESDDKKISIINLLDNPGELAKTIKDDGKKLEAIDAVDIVYKKVEICMTIEDDSKKLEAIDNIEDEYCKVTIAKTLTSDELKLQAIDNIEDEYYKAEIAKTITSDELKLQAIDNIEAEYCKVEIAKTITSDELKLQAIDNIEAEYCKAEIAKTITSDELKLEAIDNMEAEYYKAEIAKTIADDKLKLEAVGKIKNHCIVEIAATLADDELKLELIDKIEKKEYKAEIAATLANDELKLQAIDNIEDEYCKAEIAATLVDDELKSEVIDKIESESNKVKIASTIKDDDTKLHILENFNDELYKVDLARTMSDAHKIEAFHKINGKNYKLNLVRMIQDDKIQYDLLLEIGIEKEKLDLLYKMKQKNSTIIESVNFDILDQKYLDIFGEEKLNILTCYGEIQKKILQLDGKELEIFKNCIEKYGEERDGWTTYADTILKNLDSKQYKELIDNIDDIDKIDIEMLARIMQNTNFFELKVPEDIENFEEIKRKKCDEIMARSGNLQEKKMALLQKIYGQDMEYTLEMIGKYGQDIENINDGVEKDYILSLQEIMGIEDEEILQQIYNECIEIETIDKSYMKESLNKEFFKKYQDELFKPYDEEAKSVKIEGLEGFELYDAGTNFSMLITSVGAFSGVASHSYEDEYDYKDNWNQPALATQHFCASYIRNDMIGTAPRGNICYGFCDLKDDALMLSGNGDIYSNRNEFVSKTVSSRQERYYTPDEQINKTERYNEMDIRRFQGGERKQPDYIVAFKQNGKIENLDSVIKAAKNWGTDMPIVVVDIDKCIEAEKEKVDKMLEEYSKTRDGELREKITQKIRNNNVTTKMNTMMEPFETSFKDKLSELGIDTKEKEEDLQDKEKKVTKKDLEDNSQEVSAIERKEVYTKIKNLMYVIKNAHIEREDENEQR